MTVIGNGGYSGDFDPSGYVEGNPYTYPGAPAIVPGVGDSLLLGWDEQYIEPGGNRIYYYWRQPSDVIELLDISGPVVLHVMAIGGGGGGGGGRYAGGGGAGEIQFAELTIDQNTPMSIGAPGTGGASPNGRGSTGGQTHVVDPADPLGTRQLVASGGGGGGAPGVRPIAVLGSSGGIADGGQPAASAGGDGLVHTGGANGFGTGGGGAGEPGHDPTYPVTLPTGPGELEWTGYDGGKGYLHGDGRYYGGGGAGGAGGDTVAGRDGVPATRFDHFAQGGRGGGGASGIESFTSPTGTLISNVQPGDGVAGTGGGGGGSGSAATGGALGGRGVIVGDMPPPAVPFEYAPGSWWRISAPGTIDGKSVAVGDRMYVKDADVPSASATEWLIVRIADDPWVRPVPPLAGCPLPFWPDHRIVVEMFYFATTPGVAVPLTSQQSLDTEPTWNDVTPDSFEIRIVRGDTENRPRVDVGECVIRWLDVDADLFPFSPSILAERPNVGSFTRVSVVDEFGSATTLFVGRVERIYDEHDETVRDVVVECFGLEADLSAPIDWVRPRNELTSSRLISALADAGWQWATWIQQQTPGVPWPGADVPQRDVTATGESAPAAVTAIDQTALGAGWVFDTGPDGTPRVMLYPLAARFDGNGQPMQPVIDVTDCKGHPEIASPRILYAQDTLETLNYVELVAPATDAAGETGSLAIDQDSIDKIGRRARAFGFPITDSTAIDSTRDALAAEMLDRFKDAQVRVAEIVADPRVDGRWLDELPHIDRGVQVNVERRGFASTYPLEVVAVVVGYEHEIGRSNWLSTIFTSTQSVSGAPTTVRTIDTGDPRTIDTGNTRTVGDATP